MAASRSSTLPRVGVLGTGGTIAGAGAAPGEQGPGSSAYRAGVIGTAELLQAAPGLERLAHIEAEQLLQIDSADFTDVLLLQLARRVAQWCASDAVDAVVITHGTDTLEESAYFLHLCLPSSKPVVLTGAMRPATALSADGPANLWQAVAVAAHASSHGRGVLVLMNDQIYSARDVRKCHSLGLDAFASSHGPLGQMVEGEPRWYRRLDRLHTTASVFDIDRVQQLPLVGLVSGHGNMQAEIYDAWVAMGARAIVHAGFGAGTVPAYLQAHLDALAARGIWMVRCSRTGGPVPLGVSAPGWVQADDQSPERTRLLAALALAHGLDLPDLQQAFFSY